MFVLLFGIIYMELCIKTKENDKFRKTRKRNRRIIRK